jgi:hypothetical protein
VGAFDNFILKDSRVVVDPEMDNSEVLPFGLVGPVEVHSYGSVRVFRAISTKEARARDPRRAGRELGRAFAALGQQSTFGSEEELNTENDHGISDHTHRPQGY